MAPDRHRRPGYSRKAQYSLFIGYVIAVLGAAIGLLLAIVSVTDPVGFASLRRGVAEISATVSRATSSVTGTVGGVDESVSAYVAAGSQNQRLRRDLTAAHRRLVATSALEEENRQLRSLLKLTRVQDNIVVATRLLSSTSTSGRRMAILDAGRNRGVQAGQPVRAADGLIGRVLDSGPTVSRVLLLSDPENVIPVRRASDGLPGLATGSANGDLDVRPLNLGINPFKAGDIIVTSGSGGLYQPNIPVGIIVGRKNDGATARPLADPAKVDAVLVQQSYTAGETPVRTTAAALPAVPSAAPPAPTE